jgi:zinc transport system substrate-binding protein
MMTGVLTACGNSSSNTTDSEKISVVCTMFPQYDWVMQILGDKVDNVDMTLLLDNGVDLHNYQPTTDDIVKVSSCDMFIYVGGESDAWVDDALKEAANKDRVVINLLDVLGDSVKEEEVKEGMESEEEAESEDTVEEPEYDEHIWLSLKNAKTLCDYIATELGKLDTDNADTYSANANNYITQLTSLDSDYQDVVDAAMFKTLLFGDRFPFRYLVDDYGLDYYAAFVGCSAETEASFETVVFLANKIDELGLNNVMVIESSDQKIANTIIQNSTDKDKSILVLDSMQSVTVSDVTDGTTYLSVMQSNLEVLKEALK